MQIRSAVAGKFFLYFSTRSEQGVSLNPYDAGGYFGQYKMMQKKLEKILKPGQMGTHLRVLSESFPMNTNLTGFR